MASPLSKLVSLSYILAVGFLLVVLAGAIYGLWLLIGSLFFFCTAHLPIALTNSYSRDYLMDELVDLVADFGKFLLGALLVSGIACPLVLAHCNVIPHILALMTIVGGLLIYLSIVTFTVYFEEDRDEFDI